MKKILLFGTIILLFAACTTNTDSDAYGNFEAVETIISAEANGKLIKFSISEGDKITENSTIGIIDTVSLYLQKGQLLASKKGVESRIPNILSQINVYKEQLLTLEKDQKRIAKLFKSGAATQKQVDDIDGAINVSKRQIESIETQNAGVFSEIKSLEWKIKSIEDQIRKCIIINPINGTVLEKYVEENEFVNLAKPLYKIANLDEINLRIYVSGSQMSSIKIGQKVKVLFDKDKDSNSETEGVITWISSQSEFTPKIIQTKEERVKLVYAVKVKVKNDGRIKIGMPGEVIF